MQRGRALAPLPGEPAAAYEAQAMLAGHRAAEVQRHRQQIVGGARRAAELVRVVGREQECRVDVAVARVTPAAGRQAVAAADLERSLDRLFQSVERDGEVLAQLRAELRR